MELLDVLDENGNLTGRAEERKIVHEQGLWHIHVGVWIMNQKGELLFQKRSPNKIINPNKWTRTGGHVDSGETPIKGIQRETEEEIGVKIPLEKFENIGIDKVQIYFEDKKIYNRHFVYNYFAMVDYKLKDYKIQTEEVSDLKYMTIEEIEEARKNNDENYTFIKFEKDKYERIITILKQKRKEKLGLKKSIYITKSLSLITKSKKSFQIKINFTKGRI